MLFTHGTGVQRPRPDAPGHGDLSAGVTPGDSSQCEQLPAAGADGGTVRAAGAVSGIMEAVSGNVRAGEADSYPIYMSAKIRRIYVTFGLTLV